MKNVLILLTLVILFIQCGKDPVTPEFTAKVGEEFKIQLDQTISLTSSNERLPVKLKLISAIDEFCPQGAFCETEGSATIKIGKEEDDFSNPMTLCIGECDYPNPPKETDSINFTYAKKEYRLIFKNIYSDFDREKLKKTFKDVTLLIKKL